MWKKPCDKILSLRDSTLRLHVQGSVKIDRRHCFTKEELRKQPRLPFRGSNRQYGCGNWSSVKIRGSVPELNVDLVERGRAALMCCFASIADRFARKPCKTKCITGGQDTCELVCSLPFSLPEVVVKTGAVTCRIGCQEC